MSNRRRVDLMSDEYLQGTQYKTVDEMYGPIPRLIRRNQQFDQSRNTLNIELKDLSKNAHKLRKADWFHVFLRIPTHKSLLMMLSFWTISVMIFAGLYMITDYAYGKTNCGLAPDSLDSPTMTYGGYFAFSLETTTTVGYGLPGGNSFFENCSMLQFVIYLQMVFSMLYNAFLFAFFFTRLAKTENRGSQVIFSKTAIISRSTLNDQDEDNLLSYHLTRSGRKSKFDDDDDDDKRPWMLSLRVADVDAKYPVVEAHVRMYAKVGTQLIEMRVLSPNDEIGANLFLSWPLTVKHEIDIHSPLHPPIDDPYRLLNNGLNLRNADSVVGSVEQYACPVCGESYGDMHRLRKHVEYCCVQEKHDEYPIKGTHQELDPSKIQPPSPPSGNEILDWFPDEIIIVVEGIDSLQSGTFQALQSYTVNEISWGGTFEDCVLFRRDGTTVDLNKFHNVLNSDHDFVQSSGTDLAASFKIRNKAFILKNRGKNIRNGVSFDEEEGEGMIIQDEISRKNIVNINNKCDSKSASSSFENQPTQVDDTKTMKNQ